MLRLTRTLGMRMQSTSGVSSLFDAALKDVQKGNTSKPLPTFTTGNMRVSPQKLNHLARLIRGMSLDEAEQQMAMILKKRGKDVKDLIVRVGHVLSHNYGKNKDDFIIKQAWVGKGVFLKRLWIHGRGRTGRMTRPTAHLKIMLGQKISQDSKSIELQKLVKQFKRHRLFVSLKDKQPIRPAYPIWSSKPWKYVTSPKWIESSNANVNKKI